MSAALHITPPSPFGPTAPFTELADRARSLGYGLQALLPTDDDSGGYNHLWIVCNTGAAAQERWRRGHQLATLLAERDTCDPWCPGPLDAFCRGELRRLLKARPFRFLFPHDPREQPYPLVPLLKAAGWYRPSPIMQTIHPRYGSWWAVRAVVALSLSEEEAQDFVSDELGADPCRGCAAPCVSACSSGAVTTNGWAWEPCVTERLSEGCACSEACPARLACRVGRDYRYPAPIIAYHHQASLQLLKKTMEAGKH